MFMIPMARFSFASAVVALVFIVLGLSRAAAAADDLRSLQDTLNNINQEQLAIYQQFQMIQELRRRDTEAARLPTVGQRVGPPGNYDDVVAEQKAQFERDARYSRQLDELYSRHRDLDRERRSIMESMQKLRQASRPAGG
jgi:hypothetical protein